ncbi:MAG TPA: prenyltransferase/squalene oxidase repeat-containing protein [Gemmataceae bacterium]|nr:prenyltransferase/squalene oxidase repeat-containing protein [Gemmataceae bacterium]
MSDPYLIQLAAQLIQGLGQLPSKGLARHVAFLRSMQNQDGGFSGREGGSDLYYTGFALRGLAVLDALTTEVTERAAAYLRSRLTTDASVVDFFSLLYAAALVQAAGGPDIFAESPTGWDERVAQLLETFRTPDGGYTKAAGNASGSTYHTFLVGLCYQLLGRSLPRPQEVVRFIRSRRREDGGFVEITPMRRGGTNPTAAAVGVLQMIDAEQGDATALSPEIHDGVVQFLVEMPSPEGGFRANGRAPLADLLSTFTGLWTLHQLGAFARVDVTAALGYVRMLELCDGGFRGGLWDQQTDVEYTFYGLGCLGILPEENS